MLVASFPRPLVIVLVVLLILAVVGCAATVLRGREQASSDDERATELREGGIADLLSRLAPPSAPIELMAANVSCTLAGDSLQVAGTCSIDVPPTDAPRRSLLLRPASGAMLMSVTVTHDGEPESDSLLVTSNSDEGSVVLTPGDSAAISLSCSCVVLVNP